MAKIGSETRPVYVGANGEARPCDVDLHDISVENKGDNEVIAIITIDGTPYNIKNFKQGGNAFVVTFKDWNGTVLKTEAVLKGGNATPPTNPTREGYDFDKWDGKYTNVQQDETVTASYTQKMLTVTFKLNGGNISGSTADVVINNVAYGTKFSEVKKLVTNPTRTSTAQYNYTFNGWDKADTLEIKTNTTATAQWNSVERYYTVTFKNYNATSAAAGTTLETKSVKYGVTPEYTGTTPSVESPVTGKTYTWNSSDGWTPALVAVTGDAVYVAKYTEAAATVTVTFNLDGGNIGGSTDPVVRTVNYGTALSDVTKPDNPSKTGYNFTSWGDPDPASAISSDSKVIGNCVITSRYTSCGVFVTANADDSGPYMYDNDLSQYHDGVHYAASEMYQFTDIAFDPTTGNMVKTAMPADGNTSTKVAPWYSTDKGKTWYASPLTANRQTFVCAGYYGGQTRFLLMSERNVYGQTSEKGGIGGITYYSTDGANWEKCNSSQELNQQFGFAYLNIGGVDRFIKAEYCGGYDAHYSDNGGKSWTQTLEDYEYPITCVKAVGTQFIMGSSRYRNIVSSDGKKWTAVSTGWKDIATSDAHDFARGNGVTIAVCDKQILRTTDTDLMTATWTSVHTHATNDEFTSVAFGNGKFVAVSRVTDVSTDVSIYVSTDNGASWTRAASMAGANKIVYSPA